MTGAEATDRGRLDRLIAFTERAGNLLPHPLSVFLILILLVVVLSAVLSSLGVSVSYVTVVPDTGDPASSIVRVLSLAQKSVVVATMQDFVNIYASFTPVGFVIIMILGVSVAEHTGFFSAVIRTLIQRTPPALITFVIALVGICANVASDAGIIIAPTLGGAIFLALKRHPVAGVCAGYVAAYGGFSANIFPAGTDVVLAGITQSAASHFAIDAAIHPLMDWYCMMGSTLVLAMVVTIVTERVIVPFLGDYHPPGNLVFDSPKDFQLRAGEKKGLVAATVATIVFLGFLLLATVPSDALLRNADG